VFRKEWRSRRRLLLEERDGVRDRVEVAFRGRDAVDVPVERTRERLRVVVVRAVDTLPIVGERLDECPIDRPRRRVSLLIAILAREVEPLREVDRLEDDEVVGVRRLERSVDLGAEFVD